MLPATGYALREQNRYILDDPSINAVEITFERADDPLRVDRYIGDDIDFEHVSVHALKLSPGSPDAPAEQYLSALKAIAEENGAQSISDHLGFTRDGDNGVEMGHFAPVPMTEEALDNCSRNIELIMNYFDPVEFYLENIAYLFRLQGTLNEADFISRLLERTGTGLLLDVTNVYVNALNFNFDMYEFVEQVTSSAQRVQMHLARQDVQDEWDDMDEYWEKFRQKVEDIRHDAEGVSEETRQTAHNLGEELKSGYERIRKRLK